MNTTAANDKLQWHDGGLHRRIMVPSPGPFCQGCQCRMGSKEQPPAKTAHAKHDGFDCFIDETEAGSYSWTISTPHFQVDCQQEGWLDTAEEAKEACATFAQQLHLID